MVQLTSSSKSEPSKLQLMYNELLGEAVKDLPAKEYTAKDAASLAIKLIKLAENDRRSLKSIVAAVTVEVAHQRLYLHAGDGTLRGFLHEAELPSHQITRLTQLAAISLYLIENGVDHAKYLEPDTYYKVMEVAGHVNDMIKSTPDNLDAIVDALDCIAAQQGIRAVRALYQGADNDKDSYGIDTAGDRAVIMVVVRNPTEQRMSRYRNALSKLARQELVLAEHKEEERSVRYSARMYLEKGE